MTRSNNSDPEVGDDRDSFRIYLVQRVLEWLWINQSNAAKFGSKQKNMIGHFKVGKQLFYVRGFFESTNFNTPRNISKSWIEITILLAYVTNDFLICKAISFEILQGQLAYIQFLILTKDSSTRLLKKIRSWIKLKRDFGLCILLTWKWGKKNEKWNC